MRHYWHPVALADELPAERPAKAVRVLGQDFVLFRDERGRHGLLAFAFFMARDIERNVALLRAAKFEPE
jgi:hypothetical protein